MAQEVRQEGCNFELALAGLDVYEFGGALGWVKGGRTTGVWWEDVKGSFKRKLRQNEKKVTEQVCDVMEKSRYHHAHGQKGLLSD